MSKPAILETLLDGSAVQANAQTARVERLARLLADQMAAIHGGTWWVDIDHSPDIAFVTLRPRCER